MGSFCQMRKFMVAVVNDVSWPKAIIPTGTNERQLSRLYARLQPFRFRPRSREQGIGAWLQEIAGL